MKKRFFLLSILIFVGTECPQEKASIKLKEDPNGTITNKIEEDVNVPKEKQGRKLVWYDEFSNDLDEDNWEVMLGDGSEQGIPGWGNNEKQYYQRQNITVVDGKLVITARRENREGKNYTSARLRTRPKHSWEQGWFEARIKLPKTEKGLWPAFWMLPYETPPVVGWPESGEIDIMEWIAKDPNHIHGTIHFGTLSSKEQKGSSYSKLNGSSFSESWHVYAIKWTEESISWYVDDQQYHVVKKLDVSTWPFNNNRFHFLLNMAVGGNWPGDPDASTSLPAFMEVDYVRVYQ